MTILNIAWQVRLVVQSGPFPAWRLQKQTTSEFERIAWTKNSLFNCSKMKIPNECWTLILNLSMASTKESQVIDHTFFLLKVLRKWKIWKPLYFLPLPATYCSSHSQVQVLCFLSTKYYEACCCCVFYLYSNDNYPKVKDERENSFFSFQNII